MSLFDYLNNDPLGSSAAASTSAQTALLLQQVQARLGDTNTTAAGTTTGTSGLSSVLITLGAQRAATAAADARKDAGTLAEEIRATLDGKGGQSTGMAGMSGRALALVALNEDGRFSKLEVAAARAELRERDRAAAAAFLSAGDVTAASLKSFSQQILAARETMSAEERLLRERDPALS